MKKIVAYYRVSTKKQGKRKGYSVPGLGLQAQKKAVEEYVAANNGKIIGEYREIESGRKANRPQLREALDHAKLSKATLVVAKLDRLARNVAFTSALMDSGVDFVCCDMPDANRVTIHIFAALAENEAVRTSERTRAALAIAKEEGKLLGSARPGHWKGREHLRGFKQATAASSKARSERARRAYAFLIPKVTALMAEAKETARQRKEETKEKLKQLRSEYKDKIREASESRAEVLQRKLDTEVEKLREYARYPALEIVANKINEMGHTTTSGMPFTPTAIHRILKRHEEANNPT